MPTTAITLPWGTVHGVGIFNTGGREYVIVAADGNVYACLENNFPVLVALPAGTSITATVKFTQGGSALYLWRGVALEPLKCEDLMTGFTPVPAPVTPGRQRIPNGIRAFIVGDRMWVQTEAGVWPSDLLDFESYDLFNNLAINSSPGDFQQTIIPFGRGTQSTIVVLKRRSVHALVNTAGDLSQLAVVTITTRFGCVAPESVADWGSDLAWLADEGVASLVLTEQGELQASVRSGREPQPMLSDPIQPLIERINWDYAANAWGAFWNGHYYLAVPLDDAEATREELAANQFLAIAPAVTATVPDLVVVGGTYRYIPTSTSVKLTNGSQVLTDQRDFTATHADVTFEVTLAGGVVGASLQRVFKGVNTAVLVYSTRNAAWAGHDAGDGLEVKQFFTAKSRARLRLFYASVEGWISMYEETFQDAAVTNYAEVEVTTTPAAGDTLQVNGGTLVTAAASISNTGTTWGVASLSTARSNLYKIVNVTSNLGYNQQNGWTAFNTRPYATAGVPVTGPVRFYATNGLSPEIVTTGTWATVTQVTKQPIAFTLVTRAYRLTAETRPGRLLGVVAQLQTWAPTYSVQALSEGVEEQQALVTDRTRSRTRYDRPFMKADWVQTNVNDDFLTPYRQDYSVVFTSETMTLTLGSGVKVDQHQEVTHTIRGAGRARAMQVKLTNTTGRLRVLAMQSEGLANDRGYGVKV